jgi:hypothetical protein
MRLNYLWIEGRLPRLQRTCIKSYIKLGYEIDFYTFTPNKIGIKHKNIFFKNAEEILSRDYDNHLHYADLFRYKLLQEKGGIWIDADLFLFKTITDDLVEDKIIISSQHCNKTGAFKKDHTNKTANIGILKLPKNDKLLIETIKKCEKSKAKLGDLSYMNFFIDMIKKLDYEKYVVEPEVYCPVSWANAKELYLKDNREFISKYGMETLCWDCIKETSTGVHLWNNIYNKNEIIIEQNSPYTDLENLVEDIKIDNDVKYCIPTFRRSDTIKQKTLATLSRHNIPPENIFIFVENEKEMKPYLQDYRYNYIITETKGIGQKRNFIRNYFKNGTKLVMIDDDVEDILLFLDKKSTISLPNLQDFVEKAFKQCEEEKVTMWGILLHDNAFYSQLGYTTKLKFIGGTLQGLIINDISRNITVDIDHFEDVEFSLKHYQKEGKILRYNNVGLKTKYYHHKGGIVEQKGGVDKREEEAWNNGTYLLGIYQNNVSLYLKKDGKLNIKLRG